jgi:hypothetical protein
MQRLGQLGKGGCSRTTTQAPTCFLLRLSIVRNQNLANQLPVLRLCLLVGSWLNSQIEDYGVKPFQLCLHPGFAILRKLLTRLLPDRA